MKVNCWQHKKCGREQGGRNVNKQGACAASLENKLDGVHHGKNGGRTCWVVAGTLCEGTVQGEFASKFGSCEKCDFYNSVKKEEYPNFFYSSVLLNKLREKEL